MAILGSIVSAARGLAVGSAAAAWILTSSCATSDPLAQRDEDLALDESSDYDDDGWVTASVVDDAPAPPPPTEVYTAPASAGTVHTVRKGDTLMSLARQYYSDAAKWRLILESNRDMIADANRIFVGQELRIP